jgi:hypothetical protein
MPGEQERVPHAAARIHCDFRVGAAGRHSAFMAQPVFILAARLRCPHAETVKALTGLLFPGDELPGAAELGIHDRVLAMAELRDAMADGVSWFDQRAKSQGAANFLALDESARSAAIEAAFASGDEAAKQFVVLLRFYAGLNYYSHPTIKAAFPYTDPPQPEGFADFQDPPR